jgi:hypothetical protein
MVVHEEIRMAGQMVVHEEIWMADQMVLVLLFSRFQNSSPISVQKTILEKSLFSAAPLLLETSSSWVEKAERVVWHSIEVDY